MVRKEQHESHEAKNYKASGKPTSLVLTSLLVIQGWKVGHHQLKILSEQIHMGASSHSCINHKPFRGFKISCAPKQNEANIALELHANHDG